MAVFQVYFYIGTTISCRGNSAALLFFYCKRGLGPAAITILLGVVFAQMMYHHSVNQQMSLKLGCLSAILESLVGFDVQKYRSPAIRLLSDWKKCTRVIGNHFTNYLILL